MVDYKNKHILENFSLDNNVLEAHFLVSNDYDVLSGFVNGLTSQLKELNARNLCDSCGEPKMLEVFTLNHSVSMFCDTCSNKILQAIDEKKKQPNNYLLGYLGSLVGALAGSIIWIVIGLFGFYASIAGYAIAYASFWGYNFLKGKNSKVGVFMNIANIVLALFFAEYVGFFIQFMKEFPELDLVSFFSLTPVLLGDTEFLLPILPNLGLGLLFAGLGSFRIIKNTLDSASREEELTLVKVEV